MISGDIGPLVPGNLLFLHALTDDVLFEAKTSWAVDFWIRGACFSGRCGRWTLKIKPVDLHP